MAYEQLLMKMIAEQVRLLEFVMLLVTGLLQMNEMAGMAIARLLDRGENSGVLSWQDEKTKGKRSLMDLFS
jgi:hypothetical protein